MSTLPGFRDFFITFIEFASCIAIVASFLKLAGTDGHENENDGVNELLIRMLFFESSSTLYGGAILLVALPRLFKHYGCNLKILHHPYFPAIVQLWKLVICAANAYRLDIEIGRMNYVDTRHNHNQSQEFELKSGDELISSGILAACEFLNAVHTIYTAFSCRKHGASTRDDDVRSWNPTPRLSQTWMFFNVWKDFGIITTLVKMNELKVLVMEIPASILFAVALTAKKITSQNGWYHVCRVLMVGAAAAGLYGETVLDGTKFELFEDKTVAIVLFACEVLLAIFEVAGPTARSRQESSITDDSYTNAC